MPVTRTRFEAVLVGPGEEAARSVEAAGGCVASLGWHQTGELDAIAGRPVLLVEAIGADADALAAALPAIAALAAARELPVVVALDETRLDAVAAELLGERVQLLCLPTPAERIAALVLAARQVAPDAFGFVSESEEDRLARLHAELARIGDLLAQLTIQESRGAHSAGDRPLRYAAPPAEVSAPLIDAAEVRRVLRARRVRERAFRAGLFEDPAWDILLDLFAADLERAEVSVSSLCIAAAVAPTTALRWIGRMTASGLLVRRRDPFDRRRALMSLSESALAGMRSYVAMLRAQGLPFV